MHMISILESMAVLKKFMNFMNNLTQPMRQVTGHKYKNIPKHKIVD